MASKITSMTQTTLPSSWYVLHTRPKFEKSICQEIEYLNVENIFYESYLPVKVVTRRWSDRIKKIEEPLFYSYVFVKTDLRHKVNLLQIPGVMRFVSTDGKPATISSEEIERIRLIEKQSSDIQNEPYYSAGDQVMVKQGAFAGMQGILIKRLNNRPRFLIRLPLLQQAISVDISVDDLMKIN
jgi:transcription antitermination factor NusG